MCNLFNSAFLLETNICFSASTKEFFSTSHTNLCNQLIDLNEGSQKKFLFDYGVLADGCSELVYWLSKISVTNDVAP